MRRAFAFSLILALPVSALFWMCPLVLANLTLTVASRPGGSVIVSSPAINNGNSFTVIPGEEHSWSVPSGAEVTLRAADFAPYLDFRGWEGPFWEWVPGGPGTYDNPVTITVWSSSKVTGVFADPSAINNIRVVLGSLRRIAADSLEIVFTVENDRAPYTVMQEIYGVRLYCDGEPMQNVGFSEVAVDPGRIHRFTAVLPLSRLGDGNHSFFVLADAVFYTPHPHPADPASLADGSGVSDMAYFVVDAVAPGVLVLSPVAGSYGSALFLDVSVNEPAAQIVYCLDGKANVTIAGNVTLYGLSEGVHTLRVYAWDEAGNVGVSEPVTFTVTSFPITLFAIAVIASAAAVSFGLVAYFLRRKRKGDFK